MASEEPKVPETAQQYKLRAVDIGAALQKLDGIGLLLIAALHDGDDIEEETVVQFRQSLSRLSHLIEAALRAREEDAKLAENTKVQGP